MAAISLESWQQARGTASEVAEGFRLHPEDEYDGVAQFWMGVTETAAANAPTTPVVLVKRGAVRRGSGNGHGAKIGETGARQPAIRLFSQMDSLTQPRNDDGAETVWPAMSGIPAYKAKS